MTNYYKVRTVARSEFSPYTSKVSGKHNGMNRTQMNAETTD
jgi:hypothetical protein